MITIKNEKGFTILEVVISMVILSVFLVPIFSGLGAINKNSLYAQKAYIATLESRNILEFSSSILKKYGIDYIINTNEENNSATDFLASEGFVKSNENFNFLISFDELKEDGKKINFTTNENINYEDESKITFINEELFLKSQSFEESYHLVLEETDDGFFVSKNEKNIDLKFDSNNLRLKNNSYSGFLKVLLKADVLQNKNIIFENKFDSNVYFKIQSDKPNEISSSTIDYYGMGSLFMEKSQVEKIRNDYLLTVVIFDEDLKFIKRLGMVL